MGQLMLEYRHKRVTLETAAGIYVDRVGAFVVITVWTEQLPLSVGFFNACVKVFKNHPDPQRLADTFDSLLLIGQNLCAEEFAV